MNMGRGYSFTLPYITLEKKYMNKGKAKIKKLTLELIQGQR